MNLYVWTTNGGVNFVGKNFHFFTTPFYYLSFGFGILFLGLDGDRQSIQYLLKKVTLSVLFFSILVIGICAIDANLKLVNCTACKNGVINLRYGDIKYGVILGISAFLSIFPSLFRLIKVSELNEI